MRFVIIALFTVLLPATATAQNRGIFVQAGPLADFLFSASTDYRTDVDPLSSRNSTYSWIDLNGDRRWQPGEEGPLVSSSLSIGLPSALRSKSLVAPGASAALGVFITPSISLRVEGSYQGEHGTETDPGDVGQFIRIEDRQSVSTTDVFVAAGWHQGESRRTTITYLGGMVFRRQRDEATLRYRIADGLLPPVIGLGGGPWPRRSACQTNPSHNVLQRRHHGRPRRCHQFLKPPRHGPASPNGRRQPRA